MAEQKSEAQDQGQAEEAMFETPAFPPLGEESEAEEQSQGQQAEGDGGEEQQDAPADTGELMRRLQALEEQNQKLEKNLSESQQRADQLMQGMLMSQSAPQPAQQTQQPVPQTPSFDDMPDPVEKPQEHKQWLSRKFAEVAQQGQQMAQQTQQSQASPAEQLWNDFLNRDDNADLRENKELAEMFARKKAQELQQRGIDPARAVTMDPAGVLGQIATEARGYIQRLRGTSHSEQGAEQQTQQMQQKPNRTAGVSAGGSQATSRPNGQTNVDFLKEIKEFQSKDGFL